MEWELGQVHWLVQVSEVGHLWRLDRPVVPQHFAPQRVHHGVPVAY